MLNSVIPTKSVDTSKTVENHKKAAKHLEEAAKLHHEAAKHHTDGNNDKACDCTVKASGHQSHARDAQKEIAREHISKS